jgi:hypothetical protein
MTPEEREEYVPRHEGESLTDWRLRALEHDNAEHYQTKNTVIGMEQNLKAAREDTRELRAEVGKLRAALYTTAGSILVGSILFVFGVLQLQGGTP